MELTKIDDLCYVIEGRINIGLIKLDSKNVCIIDSGLDKEYGRKIRQLLEKENLNLLYILNTHYHADHTGGNNYLQKYYNCNIYASSIEKVFINNPIMISGLLYGGKTNKNLINKFSYVDQSNCLSLDEYDGCIEVLNLKGHTIDMKGYKINNTVYLGDSLCSKETIDKYKIMYIYDVLEYLNTLEYIKTIKAENYVFSHTEIYHNIDDIVDYNIKSVISVKNFILSLCNKEITLENIIKKVFYKYDIKINDLQYSINRSCILSYLSYLIDSDLIETYYKDNILFYIVK